MLLFCCNHFYCSLFFFVSLVNFGFLRAIAPMPISSLVLSYLLICNKNAFCCFMSSVKKKKTKKEKHWLWWGVKRTVWRVSWLQSQQSASFHVDIDVYSIRYEDSDCAALLFPLFMSALDKFFAYPHISVVSLPRYTAAIETGCFHLFS